MTCGYTKMAGDIEYCLIRQHRNGSQAAVECKSLGYQLVAIHSQNKNDQLKSLWSRSVVMFFCFFSIHKTFYFTLIWTVQ